MRLDRDVRIEPLHRRRGAVDLRPTDIGGRVDHLPLQVRQRHRVVVDDADRADARRRQVLEQRRAEPAGADDEHPRRLQLGLTGPANIAQDQVAGIALDFFREKGHGCKIGRAVRVWKGRAGLGHALNAWPGPAARRDDGAAHHARDSRGCRSGSRPAFL